MGGVGRRSDAGDHRDATASFVTTPESEPLVTASASSRPTTAIRASGVIAAGIVLATIVFALFIAGVTFVALAIAFPVAIPLAEQYRLPISAADIALAERFAEVWWVFGLLSVASFSAAIVVAVKSIAILSPVPND
jgi:hypothetical protein